MPVKERTLTLSSDVLPWLGRLEEVDPNSFSTLTMRVRILHLQKHGEQIEPLVEPYATKLLPTLPKDQDRARLELKIGGLVLHGFVAGRGNRPFKAPAATIPTPWNRWSRVWRKSIGWTRPSPFAGRSPKQTLPRKAATVLAIALASGHPSTDDFSAGRTDAVGGSLESHAADLHFLSAMTAVRFARGEATISSR